jgi:hypothetical protein
VVTEMCLNCGSEGRAVASLAAVLLNLQWPVMSIKSNSIGCNFGVLFCGTTVPGVRNDMLSSHVVKQGQQNCSQNS